MIVKLLEIKNSDFNYINSDVADYNKNVYFYYSKSFSNIICKHKYKEHAIVVSIAI
ncbi:hypothetical protein [Borreliella valaisiana]|uniref:hypothetical protein n=1 Tax=Borreliella valaisiana TaxID=62088 RepID=UPI00016B355B|nr:hypothetical protein [Borreliella valaisiana]